MNELLSCGLATSLEFYVRLRVHSSIFSRHNKETVLTSGNHEFFIRLFWFNNIAVLEVKVAMRYDEHFVSWVVFDKSNIVSEIPVIFFFKNFNFSKFGLSLLYLVVLLFHWVNTHGHKDMIKSFALIEWVSNVLSEFNWFRCVTVDSET